MKKIVLVIFATLFHFFSMAQNQNNFSVICSSGDSLYGTLLLPKEINTKPNVVLIIAGSGPTDRDCNGLMGIKTNAYKMLADSLALVGIASVRYDKRGVGDSKLKVTEESAARFDDFVDDAVLFVRKIRDSKRFGKIFVAGHSEGSLLGILLAQKEKIDGYISIAGAGENIANTLSRQIKASAPQLAALTDSVLTQLRQGKTCKVQDPNLAQIFRESVQPFLMGWMKYDPQVEIAKLSIPILIIQGSTDIQVSVTDAENLRKAYPKAKYYLIDGMNHVFKFAPSDRTQNMATYYKPDLPIDSDLCAAIVQFCR